MNAVHHGNSDRIVANFPSVAEWVAEQTKIAGFLGAFHSIGYFRNGELVGACVFDSFTPFDCSMHLAIADPPVPEWVLRAAFAYPFKQLNLARVSAQIRADNEAALSIAKRNGFVQEGVKRKGFGECDEVLLGLLKEDCKLL